MADKLNLMFDIQSAAQEEVMGQTLVGTKLTTEERVYWFDRNHTALILELAEALEETSWKWWAKSTFFNEEQVQAELVDAWHFFLNLMNIANLTPAKLHQLYLAKRAINDARQANGYDGVLTKCPFCKRALDDPATKCYLPSGPNEVSPVGDMGFCMNNNRYYELEEVKHGADAERS